MIREDNTPRMYWPLGVVVDMFPGKDNITRSVKVRTSKGVICRPVQRLHDLEVTSYCDETDAASWVVGGEDVRTEGNDCGNSRPVSITTRSGTHGEATSKIAIVTLSR